VLKLIVYNFKIFYCLSKKNSTNNLSKYFNYKEILLLNTRLLLTLQNKLALLFNKNLLTQSKQEILIDLALVSQNKLALLFDKKLLA